MLRTKRRNPCSDITNDQLEMLHEIAKMQMGQGLDYDSKIMDKARRRAVQRFEMAQRRVEDAERELSQLESELMHEAVEQLLKSGSLEDILQGLESDPSRGRLQTEISQLRGEPQRLTRGDLDDVVSDLQRRGLTYARAPRATLTSKGARLLGRGFLSRILQRLAKRGVGPHRLEETGHGPGFASTIRPYEAGDPYERISIEDTLMESLGRGGGFRDLRMEDFRVFDAIHGTDVLFGILVDQSASMNRGGKLEAAVDTALALHELTRSQFPEDRVRLIAFSEEVRQVEPWQLPTIAVAMGYTDIRAALRAFRLSVAHESGNKQAHLITDSAPNFEDGEYVGYERALAGVINEARMYRASGIVLNVVMLDDDPRLRDMAKAIARENLGRVFFTRPGELGEALVEDYLQTKRERIRF